MAQRFVAVDLETTGLEARRDEICELGFVEVMPSLGGGWVQVGDPFHVIMPWTERVDSLLKENYIVRNMHSKSGLISAMMEQKLLVEGGDKAILQVDNDLERWVKERFGIEQPMLLGSSVSFDRGFMNWWLEASKLFHYRMIDVSTLKELAKVRQFKDLHLAPKKEDAAHRSLPDIAETLKELNLYWPIVFPV